MTNLFLRDALVGVLAALLVEWLKYDPHRSESAVWSPIPWLLGAAVVFVAAIVVYDKALPSVMRFRLQTLSPLPRYSVPQARVLVLLISRGEGASSARSALQWHLDCLERVWLVESSDAGSIAAAGELEEFIANRATVTRRRLDGVHSIRLAQALIEDILGAARRAGYRDDEIVCDLTGMTKSVSAGMLLASVHCGGRLTVMEPRAFLEDGRPDHEVGSIPVEITRTETEEE